MSLSLVVLALAWVAWCALHSLAISPNASARLRQWLGRPSCTDRLIYNLVATATLLPVALAYLLAPSEPLLIWSFWALPIKWVCWLCAGWLLWAGARTYDVRRFLGLVDADMSAPSQPEPLVTDGILSRTRHPWYLAVLLMLWSHDLAARDLVTSSLLSLYLVIGTHLEERRLLGRYGDAYRAYRERVPMFLPFRWRR